MGKKSLDPPVVSSVQFWKFFQVISYQANCTKNGKSLIQNKNVIKNFKWEGVRI